MTRSPLSAGPPKPRHGIARVLSKLGACSRSQAERAVREGRVTVNGKLVLDPERSVDAEYQQIALDGIAVTAVSRVYVAMNKPRGVMVTASDERGRDTVYDLLKDASLPWVGPVGRLDRASEGLLLLSNDSIWAARLTEPRHHIDKTYHVQIDCVPDAGLLERLHTGVMDENEWLSAKHVALLRHGQRNAWLEVVLDEGRNRHIRRLLAMHDIAVLRLIRVAIAGLSLGDLTKGQWRHLTAAEVDALGAAAN